MSNLVNKDKDISSRTQQTLKVIKQIQEKEQALYKQLDAEYAAGGLTTESGSLAPGCYVKTQSCPKQPSFKALSWTRDTWGEQNRNAGVERDACVVKRKNDYNRWCGINNTEMKFVSSDNTPVNTNIQYLMTNGFDTTPGQQYKSTKGTADKCKQDCNADKNCIGFTYNTQQQMCYFKNKSIGMFPYNKGKNTNVASQIYAKPMIQVGKVHVGSSGSNPKTVQLNKDGLYVGTGANGRGINKQNPGWNDRFVTSVSGRNLTVKRTDISDKSNADKVVGWSVITPGSVQYNIFVYQGFIYSIGMNRAIYRISVGGGNWTYFKSCCVTNIFIYDGFIYGIGTDRAVWRTPIGAGGWTKFKSCCVRQVVVYQGQIYGLGNDNAIWKTPANGGPFNWNRVTTGSVFWFVIYKNNIYGVGGDKAVYRVSINGGSWERIVGGSVNKIFIDNDVIYGIGTNRAIYKTPIKGYQPWRYIRSCCVTDIFIYKGTIYGLGTNRRIYKTPVIAPQGGWGQDLSLPIYEVNASTGIKTAPNKNKINKLLAEINKLSQARIGLFSNIQNVYGSTQDNVSSSRNNLAQQFTSTKVIEDQMNNVKKNIGLIEGNKYNTLRMVEINKYASDRYGAYAELFKVIIYCCLPMLALGIIMKYKLIPERIMSRQSSNDVLIMLMSVNVMLGLYFIIVQCVDIDNRDNMNFEEMYTKDKMDPDDAKTGSDDLLKTEKNDFDDICLTDDCEKRKKDAEYVCPKSFPNLRSFKDSDEWWCYKDTYDGPGCNVETDLPAPNKGTWGKKSDFPNCI